MKTSVGTDLMKANKSWFKRLWAACSQLTNVVWFNGSPNETVSARCYRQGVLNGNPGWYRLYLIVNALAFWQSNHCRGAYHTDVLFARAVMEQEKVRIAEGIARARDRNNVD